MTVATPTPEKQLAGFIARFDSDVATLIRAAKTAAKK